MGKEKGDRRKGNAKPSSSERSAEIIGSSKNVVGFSALKDLGYVTVGSQSISDDDDALYVGFRLALRRMSKKDSVTKIKALQEFDALCRDEDLESVKTVLPYWPRLFCKLSIDSDWKVREATQRSHAALLNRIGRLLAPHLKEIMPGWILAMVDPHIPSQSLAVKSFEAVFSEEKRTSVMMYSSKEILAYLFDNLYNQTPEMLTGPSVSAKDEIEEKYLLLVSSSLLALSLLHSHQSKATEKKDKVHMHLQPYLASPKLWTFAQHSSSIVRSSWYSFMKVLLESDYSMDEEFVEKLSCIIFSSLNDKEVIVSPYIWAAFYHLCLHKPEAWKYSGGVKKVVQQLHSVLQDSSCGLSGHLYPLLLPVLHIILKHIEDKSKFFLEFFTSFLRGFRGEKTLATHPNAEVILQSLFECLLYASKNCLDKLLWSKVIQICLVDLLQDSFSSSAISPNHILYRHVGVLLRYWNSHLLDEACHYYFLEEFWKNFVSLCLVIYKDPNYKALSRIAAFFESISVLKTSSRKSPPQHRAERELHNLAALEALNSKEDEFIENTSRVLSEFAQLTYSEFEKQGEIGFLAIFSALLCSFPSKCIFEKLASGKEGNVHLYCMQNFILPHMVKEGKKLLEYLNVLFFAIYDLLEENEKESILYELEHRLSPLAMHLLIESIVDKYQKDEVACLWLRSSSFVSTLVKWVQQLMDAVLAAAGNIEPPMVPLHDLVKYLFSNGNKKDCIILPQHLSCLIDIFRLSVPDTDHLGSVEVRDKDIEEKIISFKCSTLSSVLKNPFCWEFSNMKDFFMSVFKAFLELQSCFTPETMTLLRSTLIGAVAAEMATVDSLTECSLTDSCLIRDLCTEIKGQILNDTTSYSRTFTLCSLVKDLFAVVLESTKVDEEIETNLDHEHVQVAFDWLLPSHEELSQVKHQFSYYYIIPGIIDGTLTCTEPPEDVKYSLVSPNVQSRIWLFYCYLLQALICDKSVYDLKGEILLCDAAEACADLTCDTAKVENISFGHYLWIIPPSLHALCHDLVELDTWRNKQKELINKDWVDGLELLRKIVKYLLNMMNLGNKRLIIKNIKESCLEGSYLWCRTLSHVLQDWIDSSELEVLKLLANLPEMETATHNIKQVFLHVLPNSEVQKIISTCSATLKICKDDKSHSTCNNRLLAHALRQNGAFIQEEELLSVFEILIHWSNSENDTFLVIQDAGSYSWTEVNWVISIINLLESLVDKFGKQLHDDHWDFILCFLSSWALTVKPEKMCDYKTGRDIFIGSLFSIIGTASKLMRELEENAEKRNDFPTTLLRDWNEFFAPSLCRSSFTYFLYFSVSEDATIMHHSIIIAICNGVLFVRKEELLSHELPLILNIAHEDELMLPECEQAILNHLVPIMLSGKHPSIQYTAYYLLATVCPHVMMLWDSLTQSIEDNEEIGQMKLPLSMISILCQIEPVLMPELTGREFGSDLPVSSNAEIQRHVFAYLLAWSLILKAISCSSDVCTSRYIFNLRESGHLTTLFHSLFQLLPSHSCLERNVDFKDQQLNLLQTVLVFSPLRTLDSHLLWWFVCRVYFGCCQFLPAEVRQWWTSLDHASQQIVEQYTLAYVSPHLIAHEFSTINNSPVKYDNMVVRTRLGTREVVATYSIDDARMELVLCLAQNHPLSNITLEHHHRIGVSVGQWRNWLFGMNTLLSLRNTSLLQSLEFWKQNVDKKFEGIEECFICYYVLHGTTNQLPKLQCRTCKKKYHSSCLYKWFSTSHNNTCPLCRSLF